MLVLENKKFMRGLDKMEEACNELLRNWFSSNKYVMIASAVANRPQMAPEEAFYWLSIATSYAQKAVTNIKFETVYSGELLDGYSDDK